MKVPESEVRSQKSEVRSCFPLPTSHFSLLTVLILWACLCTTVWAGEERIAELTVAVDSNDAIRVSAELIRWMNPGLAEDIENGIPKDLFYTIVLKKRIGVWFDEEITSKTIKYTIKYDVLKKQYLITSWEGDTTQQKVAETRQEMMDLISKVNNVKMALVKKLKTRHTYYVSVKAEMKASRLPFFLEYILFFIPVPELETPWADSAPFYALESRLKKGS